MDEPPRLRGAARRGKSEPGSYNGSGIKRDAFGVVGNSCLFSSKISETRPLSLVYVINLLCETCFIN